MSEILDDCKRFIVQTAQSMGITALPTFEKPRVGSVSFSQLGSHEFAHMSAYLAFHLSMERVGNPFSAGVVDGELARDYCKTVAFNSSVSQYYKQSVQNNIILESSCGIEDLDTKVYLLGLYLLTLMQSGMKGSYSEFAFLLSFL